MGERGGVVFLSSRRRYRLCEERAQQQHHCRLHREGGAEGVGEKADPPTLEGGRKQAISGGRAAPAVAVVY